MLTSKLLRNNSQKLSLFIAAISIKTLWQIEKKSSSVKVLWKQLQDFPIDIVSQSFLLLDFDWNSFISLLVASTIPCHVKKFKSQFHKNKYSLGSGVNWKAMMIIDFNLKKKHISPHKRPSGHKNFTVRASKQTFNARCEEKL